MDVRNHKGFGHGLTPGTTEDINCHACKAEKAAGKVPDITKAGEPFRLTGCTCPPLDNELARTWHYGACPWAMR